MLNEMNVPMNEAVCWGQRVSFSKTIYNTINPSQQPCQGQLNLPEPEARSSNAVLISDAIGSTSEFELRKSESKRKSEVTGNSKKNKYAGIAPFFLAGQWESGLHARIK